MPLLSNRIMIPRQSWMFVCSFASAMIRSNSFCGVAQSVATLQQPRHPKNERVKVNKVTISGNFQAMGDSEANDRRADGDDMHQLKGAAQRATHKGDNNPVPDGNSNRSVKRTGNVVRIRTGVGQDTSADAPSSSHKGAFSHINSVLRTGRPQYRTEKGNAAGISSDWLWRDEEDESSFVARYLETMSMSMPPTGMPSFPPDSAFARIGSITDLLPEAADAATSIATSGMRENVVVVADGRSGDLEFPHGNIRPLATVGERDIFTGRAIVGRPDGHGAYLPDDLTVRIVVQSESFGPVGETNESYPYTVNDGLATFTGSHVQFVDYERDMLSRYLLSDFPASHMVRGFGQVIDRIVNLRGELVGPRNVSGAATRIGAHFSNTDADGNYVLKSFPMAADWTMMSLCSAHLEQRHQWGKGIGLERDAYITNEEQINIRDNATAFVGLCPHVIDVEAKTAFAVGVFGCGGYEKVVEIRSGHPDYVAFAISGYNGAIYNSTGKFHHSLLRRRNDEYRKKLDGSPYQSPVDTVPARIYIGVKGLVEDGSKAPLDDFLASNGLRYGKMYGFAIDMSADGPTAGSFRDRFHRGKVNGDEVRGKFLPIDWRWNGTVTDFVHDAAWQFQDPPPGYENTTWRFWNAKDGDGFKTEQLASDPRPEMSAFIQGSSYGYFGHYYTNNLPKELASVSGTENLPSELNATYFVYQGRSSITHQIHLGDKGQYSPRCMSYGCFNATLNCDGVRNRTKDTLTSLDGLEIIHTTNNQIHAIVQEDSSNECGERLFVTGPLTHDGHPLDYYFVAMAGGTHNTRVANRVGIPAGTFTDAKYGSEFSGAFDLSGLLRKRGGDFTLRASDPGYRKREEDAKVGLNEKYITTVLQAENLRGGVIAELDADRGGQWLLYQPNVLDQPDSGVKL